MSYFSMKEKTRKGLAQQEIFIGGQVERVYVTSEHTAQNQRQAFPFLRASS